MMIEDLSVWRLCVMDGVCGVVWCVCFDVVGVRI